MTFLSAALPGVAAAQDAQYWTYQYGTRANLLGGAVVGSVVDVSATYYNPGALALIEEPELVATSKVFELTQLALQPDIGTQIDLDNLRFDLAPGFVGGIAPFAFLGDDVLGYSIFTRHQFKANLDATSVGALDELPGVTEEGDYLGLVNCGSGSPGRVGSAGEPLLGSPPTWRAATTSSRIEPCSSR
jgi:hypothetical protein